VHNTNKQTSRNTDEQWHIPGASNVPPNSIFISSAIFARLTVVSKSSLIGQLLVTLQLICHFLGLNIGNKSLLVATALFHILHVIPHIFAVSSRLLVPPLNVGFNNW